MLLSPSQIRLYYISKTIIIPKIWNVSRKHFRVVLGDGRFVKLNHFLNSLDAEDVRFLCMKLRLMRAREAITDVANYLFPRATVLIVGSNGSKS